MQLFNNWTYLDSEGTSTGSGEIEIEPNTWQLIAIPIQYGYWDIPTSGLIHDESTISKVQNYVIDQLTHKYGDISSKIEVLNTFIGDDGFFRSYVTAAPPSESSDHNFPMIYVDGSRNEVVGFWVKSIYNSTMIIEWGE